MLVRRQGLFLCPVDTETVRARQRRPPRRKGPASLTGVQVQRWRAVEDDPPATFSELRDFR
jgi:hypothetical protein